MGALDKIFDNFEMLYDNYTDMPETREARNNIFRHIEEKGIDMAQMEPYISALIAEYERQGFLYGFRYAAALFMDGTLQYRAEVTDICCAEKLERAASERKIKD